ncbi:MAG: EAL domain-containing protein [Kofleriaceae bacterium]|nr:EAL domain-containing protein [Kofleriaceae bacterium]
MMSSESRSQDFPIVELEAIETQPLGKASVLVVDDDAAVLRAHTRTLARTQLDVVTASSGDEALIRLQERAFDVVVTDISMPGMNGIDFLRAVRLVDADLPVLFVTGEASLDTAIDAVELGATRYLAKPVEPEVLRASVASSARMYRSILRGREAASSSGLAILLRGEAALEAAFDRALSTLHMVAQPIMSALTGSRVAWEMLVRTRSSELPHPGALFSAAERLDRVRELGRIIRAAVVDLLPLIPEDEMVFVNLHPDDLLDDELFDGSAPLAEQSFRIVLEVTERTALGHVDGLAERLARLRKLGYRIAVDDLGAGYAALSAVVAMRPDVVKLDMSLIRGVDADDVRKGVVSSVVGMCRMLGVWTVAEGIETEAELAAVTELGCDLVQGYLLGRPAPLTPR